MYVSIDIEEAADRLATTSRFAKNREPIDFWTQLIRDVDGRWSKYMVLRSMENTRYFYGPQPSINYNSPTEVALLRANIKVRHEVYSSLETVKNMDTDSFREWLMKLHDILEYRPTEDWKNEIHATTTHTEVIIQDILPLAKQYRDPYVDGTTSGPIFTGFPKEALPSDKVEGDLIRHAYPPLKFSNWYLDAALHQIKALLNERHYQQPYIKGIANLYQLLINLHYFPSINTSLYMNIANGLLEIASIRGIEHGIQDFVSMRLQPKNYQTYFYDTVANTNREPGTHS